MIEIISFRISDRPDLAAMSKQIRQSVFVEEQHVEPALEYDEYEEESTHYLLTYDGIPVATARWRETGKGIKLERFATRLSHRNRGLGAHLLMKVLEDVIPLRKRIYLNAQLKAIPFYQREGFVKIGDQFTEAGIEHYEMERMNKE
ncbi:MAG: GNAT family N-acetyltransferase [Bacteroidales bacterium]|nr:GNAT family N-acetyltransferase [Bacteroidales bacterium]